MSPLHRLIHLIILSTKAQLRGAFAKKASRSAVEKNDGAPGIDGVTFDAIEEGGVESFLQQIKDELVSNTYRPMRVRKKEIPKGGAKSASFRFPRFVIVWSREILSSFWNRSSKLTLNRDRMDIT